MYTRCPDCNTAFRVTADVLRQAAGNVRCGGCGNAFSALEFLSETMPGPGGPAAGEKPPEPNRDSPGADELPEPDPLEQSAAFLKSLDELEGPEVRIEDTGVEWRVLAEDEVGTAADDDIAVDVEVEDQPGMHEIFESSPTPVDQFLSSSPTEVDVPEIFSEEANGPATTPVEELRFDDNTPLPEGFGLDNEPTIVPVAPSVAQDALSRNEAPTATQVDLELTQPDDWEDLLGEFETIAGELSEPSIADDLAVLEESAPDSADEPDTSYVVDDLDALLQEAANEVRHLDGLLGDSRADEIEIPADRADEPEPQPIVEAADELVAAADESGQLELIEPLDHGDDPTPAGEDTEKLAITDTHALDDVYGIGKAGEPGGEVPAEPPELTVGNMLEDSGPGFETIVMEGERFSASIDDDKFAADQEAALASLASAAQAQHEARQAAAAGKRGGRAGLAAAGIGFLGLLLAGQYVHQARNSLATIPGVNDVLGPAYRAIGRPLFPEWDVTGWRFEATRHDTDGSDSHLAISSRVGNVSRTALPYPIIAVSLSDRFEEPLGSVTLDPSEYLGDELDPRRLVAPGKSFEAAIRIRDVPENTTSFRLRVCYRAAGSRLRCKEDGFL